MGVIWLVTKWIWWPKSYEVVLDGCIVVLGRTEYYGRGGEVRRFTSGGEWLDSWGCVVSFSEEGKKCGLLSKEMQRKSCSVYFFEFLGESHKVVFLL